MWIKKLCLAFGGMICAGVMLAQELDCQVTVNHSQIQGTNVQVFKTLEKSLSDFINTRHWTQAQYASNERIRCSMNFIIKEYNEVDSRWTCELVVQSTRPVWQSSYQTVVFSFKDTDVSFNYREFDQLELRENEINNNLTAIVSYYVYLIIGLDMDTMALQSGTELIRRAGDIVVSAQTLGEAGWTPFESSSNRYALVFDYLEESMSPMRQLMYAYHRSGLDELTMSVSRIRAQITDELECLVKAKSNKPLSVWPGLFTEIKKEELINLYSQATIEEKESVVKLLSAVNPSLTSDWEKIKN